MKPSPLPKEVKKDREKMVEDLIRKGEAYFQRQDLKKRKFGRCLP